MSNILALVVGIALLVLALWLPVRLVFCLFSARARQAVNRRWLLHLLWGLYCVAFVSFATLTAIAPSNYTNRAKVYEGFGVAFAARTAISEHWRQTQTLPRSNEEAGIGLPEEFAGSYVESLTVTGGGSVVLRYEDSAKLPEEARGRSIVFVPKPDGDNLQWDCTGGDMPRKLRPRDCRAAE